MIYYLSIIIPFYNCRKFIDKSIKNSIEVLKKNPNIEIIYINNNSSDSSGIILKDKIKNIKNIKFFITNKKNGMGPGIARNLGIKKANSNLIMFLDADDYVETKYLNSLLEYCKKFKDNFFFLNMKSKKKHPILRYGKKNLKLFFRNSNNMLAIGKVFEKKFLIKNNLSFKKNIYEDVNFIFKCHFYNKKKLAYFPKKIYVKTENPESITNSKITFNHIKCKFNAFKSIETFLKKKNLRIFNNLYKDIQYRFRGEFYNTYNDIIHSNLNKQVKEALVSYTKNLYINSINPEFKMITTKDKFTKKRLFNV
jgi:poly(ribitol-phosphate) beta-N-acetylglucosaminyltransferase